MNSNEKYFYQQAIDREMELLMRKMRAKQVIADHNQKMYDDMIECEENFKKEGAIWKRKKKEKFGWPTYQQVINISLTGSK